MFLWNKKKYLKNYKYIYNVFKKINQPTYIKKIKYI